MKAIALPKNIRIRSKNLLAAALLGFIACGFTACQQGGNESKEEAYTVDHSDPASVLQAVFDVAGGGDPALLGSLCDPQGKNDGDTRRICESVADYDPQGEFVQYFKRAKINGEPRMLGEKPKSPSCLDRTATSLKRW